MASTPDLIRKAVEQIQGEIPGLANLKLVLGLELRAKGDTQIYRVALPGPDISKRVPDDARLTVSIPRPVFNEMIANGKVEGWREAYEHGQVRVEGDPRVQKLIASVIEKHQARARVRKVH